MMLEQFRYWDVCAVVAALDVAIVILAKWEGSIRPVLVRAHQRKLEHDRTAQ